MGKNFKNIDDLYRSELGGDVTKAPDFVKENIDNALGFKKRKRGFLLLGLVVLITGTGLGLIYFSGDEEKQYAQWGLDNITPPVLDKNFVDEPVVETLTDENNSQNLTTFPPSDASSSQNTFNTNNSTSLTIIRNVNSGNNPETSSSETNNNGSGTARLDDSNRNSSQAAGTDMADGGSAVENNLNTSNPETQSIPNDLGSDENDNRTETNENNSSDLEKEDRTEAVNDSNEVTNTANENDQAVNETLTEEEIVEEHYNAESETDENETPEQDSLTDNANDENTIIDPPPVDNYKPWMVSLTSGLNLTRSSYQSTDMDQKVLYDNANSDRFGNQTNLDFTYRLKNGLAFGSGLGLVNFEEDYNFITTKTESNTITSTKPIFEYEYEYGMYFSSPVDTFEVVDTIFFITDSTAYLVDSVEVYEFESSTSEIEHSGRNKASYLNIPIHFGAQMQFNKFQIDLYASARFNFLLRSSGGYQLGNAFIPFGGSSSIYKPFYVDLMLASKVHYNFWKNLYVTGSVQYRPVIGSAYKELPFSKTFDYVHFGVGLSMRF